MIPSKARRKRLKNGAVLAASLALHAALLTVLAWPVVTAFPDRSNDEDALAVTLEQRPRPPLAAPQPASAPADATPLQPRLARLVAPASVASLVTPTRPHASSQGAPSQGAGPQNLHPAPLPEGPRGDLRTALRGSPVGCANGEAIGLNRRELEHCDDIFGKAGHGKTYDAPIDPAKRRDFDAQALRQQADRAYRDAPMGVGVDHRSREGPGTKKDIPWVLGAEQDGPGRQLGPEQQQLKRLDDARKADERRKQAARENEQP